jgi:hypothetical protein
MLTKIVDGIEVICSQEEEDYIKAVWLTNKITPQKQKMVELKTLANQYRNYILDLQLSWLSATVFDGETEVEKKEQIQADLLDVKTQYLLDMEEVKLKYS